MAMTWCLQCNKPVSEEKIVFFTLPTGKKRRMCETCRENAIERRKVRKIKDSFNNKGV